MIRFAPTLESPLHIGNFRILLANYLYALKHDLNFIFRVDLASYINAQDEQMSFLNTLNECEKIGISFSNVIFQRNRKLIYKEIFDKLNAMGYLNFIDNAVYLNLGLDYDDNVSYEDAIFGLLSKKHRYLKNPVIFSIDEDSFFYNFTSAVDDVIENISLVIRGADHIDNTYTQILLMKRICEVLNKDFTIKFAHVPLCIKHTGEKISKTEDLSKYRIFNLFNNEKIMILSFIHYLLFNNKKIKHSLREYIDNFELSQIGTSMKRINLEELLSINKKFINRLNSDSLSQQLSYFDIYIDNDFLSVFAPYVNTVDDITKCYKSFEDLCNISSIKSMLNLTSNLCTDDLEKNILSLYKSNIFSKEYFNYFLLYISKIRI